MSDDRIERALRQGPPDEPVYTPIAPELIDAKLSGRPVVADRPRSRRPSLALPWYRRATSGVGALAAVVVVGFVVVASLFIREDLLRVGAPPPDALARIRAAGTIRIAITTGPPQVRGQGGEIAGFDVDVAGALAEELGVDAVRSFDATPAILDPTTSPAWDAALTAGVRRDGLRETAPYYHWPVWVIVRAASPMRDLDDLRAGHRVCVVAGSVGARWLAGQVSGPTVPAPSGFTTVERPDEDACLTAVADGNTEAAATDALLESDIASRGFATLGGPVVVDARGAILAIGPDTDSLAATVDAALRDLRDSGRLGQLSQAAFGVDLTDPAS